MSEWTESQRNNATAIAEIPLQYIPNRDICILFLVLFGLSAFVHLVQAIFYRTYFMIPTAVFSGILEVIGWAGRLWMYINPFGPGSGGFGMQITCTIFAPTPLIAANFVILGRIIELLGTEYSRIGPKLYAAIFCTADVISLVVQSIGGGLAGSSDGDFKQAKLGTDIALAGTAFQFAVIIFYSILATEFLVRLWKKHPVRQQVNEHHEKLNQDLADQWPRTRIRIMLWAMGFNTICLIIRSIYRMIEFTEGWNGKLLTTEVYFNVLDGAMVVLAIWTLNFAHPGFLVPPRLGSQGWKGRRGVSYS